MFDIDYDGHDNINDNTDGIGEKDPRDVLVSLINKAYDTVVSFNRMLSLYLTDRISNAGAVKAVKRDIKSNINAVGKDLGVEEDNRADEAGNQQKDAAKMYEYICLCMNMYAYVCLCMLMYFYKI